MENSGAGTNRTVLPTKSEKVDTTSQRKLRANRENAKKSTGPKTARGKAFSCRNAVKHGLFTNYATDFNALAENPEEYRQLLEGLWAQYEPVGRAEEVEVERIALCCWRLKRAWRCENAVNLAAMRDHLRTELDEQRPYCKERDIAEQALLTQLQNAKKELDDTGRISEESKQKLLESPVLEEVWPKLEKLAEQGMEEADCVKLTRKMNPETRIRIRDLYAVTQAIKGVESLSGHRWTNVVETAIGRHAIPDSDALERILRYEAAIERSRARAIEQLDRLQRRRKGEFVPPSMRVHLT